LSGSLACSGVTLRRVELTSVASTLYIEEGSSLHLVAGQKLLPVAELYWQSSGSPLPEYQSFFPCAEQDPNIVVHENGRDVLMIKVDDTAASQRLFASNGKSTISVQLKINWKSISATDVSGALMWIGIICGFFLIMVVFVVVMRVMSRPTEAATADTKAAA
ncbi:hypothetical protein PENTCL1PPCAC_1289, partial [Pristionchus entomophagus]